MKSIYVTLIILLPISSTVLAQSNESHIEQVGSLHEAQIEQESPVTFNSNNDSFESQDINLFPSVLPFQAYNNHVNGPGSFAEIFQFDTKNRASIVQAGSQWAQIYQDGFHNLATVNQDGNGSVASVYQEGDQNTANVEQDLGKNEAKIVQHGSELEAIILQYGDNNFASILQDFRGSSILDNSTGFRTAEIEQTNSFNIATVEQSVPTSLPIEIVQNGNMEVHIEHH